MAGAAERVKWLLNHSADPTKRGPWGSAETIGMSSLGSERVNEVLQEGLIARKWESLGNGEFLLPIWGINCKYTLKLPWLAYLDTTSLSEFLAYIEI